MFSHPSITIVLLAHGLGTLAVIVAAWLSVRIATSAHNEQVLFERNVTRSRILGTIGLGFLVISTVLFAVSISHLLTSIIPGAMCAKGVVRAMGGMGEKVFLTTGASIIAMGGWLNVKLLNSHSKANVLAGLEARLLILAAPLVVLSLINLYQAFTALTPDHPVDCCAAIKNTGFDLHILKDLLTAPLCNVLSIAAGLLLGASALLTLFLHPKKLTFRFALVALLSVMFGIFSACYIARTHDCPYCLFLPKHYNLGYPLFLTLLIATLVGPATFLTARLGAAHSQIEKRANRQIRNSAAIQIFCLLVYFAIIFSL